MNVCLVFLFSRYTLLTVILKNAAYIECHSAECHFAMQNDILLNITLIDSVLLNAIVMILVFADGHSAKCPSARLCSAKCHSDDFCCT